MSRATVNKRHRSLSARLSDEPLITAVLALTSPNIRDQSDARRALATVIGGRPEMPDWPSIEGRYFISADWEKARTALLRWLPVASRYDKVSEQPRAALREEIQRTLYAWDAFPRLVLGPAGLELDIGDHPACVSVACALAVLPFLTPEGLPPQRLGQCAHRYCGRWFLRKPRRSLEQQRYCCLAHGNSERVMRSREKPAKPK